MFFAENVLLLIRYYVTFFML